MLLMLHIDPDGSAESGEFRVFIDMLVLSTSGRQVLGHDQGPEVKRLTSAFRAGSVRLASATFVRRLSKSASVPLRLQRGCGCQADGLDEKSAAGRTDECCADPGS